MTVPAGASTLGFKSLTTQQAAASTRGFWAHPVSGAGCRSQHTDCFEVVAGVGTALLRGDLPSQLQENWEEENERFKMEHHTVAFHVLWEGYPLSLSPPNVFAVNLKGNLPLQALV